MNLCWKNQKPFNQPGRLSWQFFGIVTELCSWLSSKWYINYGGVLCISTRQSKDRKYNKTDHICKRRSAFPSGQLVCSHFDIHHGKKSQIALWIDWKLATEFIRSGHFQLIVFYPQKVSLGGKRFHQTRRILYKNPCMMKKDLSYHLKRLKR